MQTLRILFLFTICISFFNCSDDDFKFNVESLSQTKWKGDLKEYHKGENIRNSTVGIIFYNEQEGEYDVKAENATSPTNTEFNYSIEEKNIMKKFTLLLGYLLFFVSSILGQSVEPIELAKKIFGKEKFDNISFYITGEYLGSPNGQDIAEELTTKFTLLEQTDKTAAVNMTIIDSIGKGLDTYLHFEKDSIWRMKAFRALAMTGFIEQIVSELESMTAEQVEKIIEESINTEDNNSAMFRSKDEYQFLLKNSKLTLALDDDIIKHFETHRLEFDKLRDLALEELSKTKVNDQQITKLLADQEEKYKKILVAGVSFGDYLVGSNCLSFHIGGMIDNTVGYLYVKDKKDLPQMNPSRVIMLREIGKGWYLYKTT